jgi:hypothetical protein
VDAQDPAAWVIGETSYFAEAGPGRVTVAPTVPCFVFRSVVVHEWMHLSQYADHPDPDSVWTRAGVELIADCGTLLLGEWYRPYAHERCEGCSPPHKAEARRLIGDRVPPWPF